MRAAQRLAVISSSIRADSVDATLYPDLVRKHRISGVPKTVFNDEIEILGAAPDEEFAAAAVRAAQRKPGP